MCPDRATWEAQNTSERRAFGPILRVVGVTARFNSGRAKCPSWPVRPLPQTLLRAEVPSSPPKDQRHPTGGDRLKVGGAYVAVLLAIGHDDAKLVRVVLDWLLGAIHRTPFKHSNLG